MRAKILEHGEASRQVKKIDISPPAVEKKSVVVMFLVIKINIITLPYASRICLCLCLHKHNISDLHNIITLPYASRIVSDVFPAPLCLGTVVCRGDTP